MVLYPALVEVNFLMVIPKAWIHDWLMNLWWVPFDSVTAKSRVMSGKKKSIQWPSVSLVVYICTKCWIFNLVFLFSLGAVNGSQIERVIPLRFRFGSRGGGNLRELETEVGFNQLTKGMALQPLGLVDLSVPTDVVNFLFTGNSSRPGLDLIALNIQRGRDHAIQGYIHYYDICRGHTHHSQFSDLQPNLSQQVGSV